MRPQREAYAEYVSRFLRPSYAQTPMRISRKRTGADGQQTVETIDLPFTNYFLGRQLWDEGMATAAASWCVANPQGLMLGLLGSEHVAYSCGVPARCARQLGGVQSVASVLLNPDPNVAAETAVAGVVRAMPARGSDGRVDFGGSYTLQLPFAAADVDRAAAFAAAQTHSPTSDVLALADFLLFA